jgi:hypothetical protein
VRVPLSPELALCRFSGLIAVADRQKLRITCCSYLKLPKPTQPGLVIASTSQFVIHRVPSIPLLGTIPSLTFVPIAIGSDQMSQHFIDSSHNLRDIVQSKLAGSPYVSGRNLRAELVEGEVVLTGVVTTYYQKQMAQELVRTIDGVKSVRNELEVMSR